MPIILSSPPSPAPHERTFTGLVATVTVQRAFSGLGVRVRTERLRTFSGLYAKAATGDPNALPLPGGSTGYVIHRGLPESAVSYSVSMREGEAAPRLEATLRGQVELSGTVSITVAAGGHRQTYGPFGALGYTHTHTPTGWVTQVTSADMSAADAEADSPFMEGFTEEFLPWERERDLTPYEQAQKARADALWQREVRERQRQRERAIREEMQRRPISPDRLAALQLELCRVQSQAQPAPDRRRVPVQDVLRHALNALPFPFRLGAPLPYAGDFFWASESTGVDFAGGKLIGVSFQVKGKTPVQVLDELLGPIGWQVIIRGGEAYVGPPEMPEASAATAGHLDLPADALTGVSIERVNPEAAAGNGNRQLPRRITVTGASARKWLPPLPPEQDEEGNLTDPADFGQFDNATLTGSGRVVGYSVLGVERLESETHWSKTKQGGVLTRERSVTNGMVPSVGFGQVNGQWVVQVERWAEREVRETVYSYDHPTYPKAMTAQLTTVDGYAEPLNRSVRLETTRVTQDWHDEGWLVRKVTTKETIGDWQTYESEDGKTRMTYATLTQESETEEWTSLGPEQWKHTVTRTRRSWWPMFENGESADPQRRTKTEVLVDDLTDQGPPRAPEDPEREPKDCEEEQAPGEGFPYDEALERVLEPGGRGEAVTRSIPWATSIPDVWLENVVGTIRRARPVKRTRYELAAPPKVQVGTRIKDFSLSGAAASVKATVTVEEELDVQGDA